MISFVVIAAFAVSTTFFWKNKPSGQSSSTTGKPIATINDPTPQTSQASQYNQSPYSGGGIQSVVQNPTAPNEPRSIPSQSQTELVKSLLPSVVMIKTPSGGGSGFFIDKNGVIVTNHHVLCGTTVATIYTNSGQQYQITKVLAEDRDADLMIAQVNIPELEARPLRLTSSTPEVGENIFVIGSPGLPGAGVQLPNTVTNGIVSGIRQEGSIKWIQISAPASKGNSGGPVINTRGDVIGVVSWGASPARAQNLNFCVSTQHITGLSLGSGYTLSQTASCKQQQRKQTQVKDVYCFLDAFNKVNFVEFPTDTKITRPDGSLDRVRYEQWVFEKIGGSPALINPAKEAQDYIDQHREEIFRSSFPYKGVSDRSMTNEEQYFLYNKTNRIYTDVYNRVAAKKNEAINRYRDMMHAFDMLARQRGS